MEGICRGVDDAFGLTSVDIYEYHPETERARVGVVARARRPRRGGGLRGHQLPARGAPHLPAGAGQARPCRVPHRRRGVRRRRPGAAGRDAGVGREERDRGQPRVRRRGDGAALGVEHRRRWCDSTTRRRNCSWPLPRRRPPPSTTPGSTGSATSRRVIFRRCSRRAGRSPRRWCWARCSPGSRARRRRRSHAWRAVVYEYDADGDRLILKSESGGAAAPGGDGAGHGLRARRAPRRPPHPAGGTAGRRLSRRQRPGARHPGAHAGQRRAHLRERAAALRRPVTRHPAY